MGVGVRLWRCINLMLLLLLIIIVIIIIIQVNCQLSLAIPPWVGTMTSNLWTMG